MNHTYLPSTTFAPYPTVVLTMNRESRKTVNLTNNPRVSLLVHDWVSQRTSASTTAERERSQSPVAPRTRLAALLSGLNTAALARISVTMDGEAHILQAGSEEERYCLERHVEHYAAETGDDAPDMTAIGGQDVQVVSVRIQGGRIADWKGGLRDFVVGALDGAQPVIPNGT